MANQELRIFIYLKRFLEPLCPILEHFNQPKAKEIVKTLPKQIHKMFFATYLTFC